MAVDGGYSYTIRSFPLQSDSLRIGVKYKPATCDLKAKDGDKLSMHYTGTCESSAVTLRRLRRDRRLDVVFKRAIVYLGSTRSVQGWKQV